MGKHPDQVRAGRSQAQKSNQGRYLLNVDDENPTWDDASDFEDDEMQRLEQAEMHLNGETRDVATTPHQSREDIGSQFFLRAKQVVCLFALLCFPILTWAQNIDNIALNYIHSSLTRHLESLVAKLRLLHERPRYCNLVLQELKASWSRQRYAV